MYYQIDTNPLIARISTTEKSIGATNINTASTGIPYNMVPFLAVYETAPTESLLDIYWETTSEGLIVDLNTEVASTNQAVAGFENLTWEFREDIVTGGAVTGWFRPIDNEGEPFVTPPLGELISAKNGLDADVDFFELVAGDEGSSEEGEFQIRYTGPGIVFTQGSGNLDVYAFVIRMNFGGVISEIPLGGEPQGFGALENVAPSFASINDVVKTRSEITLIPPATFASAVNGTALGGTAKKQQLVFSFYGTGSQVLPDNWTMDPTNGKMTQAIPNGDDFLGNPFGIYNVTVRLTDANAETPDNIGTPAYTSLYFEQEITIKIDFPKANPGVLPSNCIITPDYPAEAEYLIYSTGGDPQYGSYNQANRIFYIASESNSVQDFITDGIDFPDGNDPEIQILSPRRIGTEAHLDGTIAVTFNIYAPASVERGLVLKVPTVDYYYRLAGGDPTWLELPRSLEKNRVGIVSSSSSTTELQFPTKDLPRLTDFLKLYSESFEPTYVQNIRAFDYDDFNAQEGIEYAFVVKDFQQDEGDSLPANQAVGWIQVDDLYYPTCVPWQGNNLVTANGGFGQYFKHIRNLGSSSSTAYADLSLVDTAFVYSRTPYGDYVKQFYTDVTGFNIYKPVAGLNYINTTLDTSTLSPVPAQWVTLIPNATPPSSAGEAITLQWVTGYDPNTGLKVQNAGLSNGVSSIQTSNDIDYSPSDPTIRGTARFKVS